MALPGMASSGGLAGLLPVAMLAVGIISILRRRRAGRDASAPDDEAERRRGATLEMERRMASYLAGRDTGDGAFRPDAGTEQETTR